MLYNVSLVHSSLSIATHRSTQQRHQQSVSPLSLTLGLTSSFSALPLYARVSASLLASHTHPSSTQNYPHTYTLQQLLCDGRFTVTLERLLLQRETKRERERASKKQFTTSTETLRWCYMTDGHCSSGRVNLQLFGQQFLLLEFFLFITQTISPSPRCNSTSPSSNTLSLAHHTLSLMLHFLRLAKNTKRTGIRNLSLLPP